MDESKTQAPGTDAVTEPQAAAAPRSLDDVARLAEANNDPVMKVHVERDMHLVRFEPGKIDFRPSAVAPPTLASDLSEKLKQWTGASWAVLAVAEGGQATLAEQKRAMRSAGFSGPVKQAASAKPAAQSSDGVRRQAGEPSKAQGESWIETVKTIFYALLIALVIRTFLFQPFNIPSGSMKATLLVGDYLFVEKFSYGYSRYSFPLGLGPFSGRIFGSVPQRGDVVVFKTPQDNSTDFIKRVIGLPGDRVQMINGVLYLNDKPVPKVRVQDWVGNALSDTDFPVQHVKQYRETMPNGKSYYVLDATESPEDNTDVFTVPPGHYFVMGDNRDNSDDSRMSVGYVPAENLEGKAVLRFFSTDGSIFEIWKWRFDRMFTTID
jgi:signal peptidase I